MTSPAPAAQPAERVLLVLTPWASPYFTGMSVALLRSILVRDGLDCDIFYSNLLFSKVHGGNPLYEEALSKGSIAEIAFTPWYFDTDPADAAATIQSYFEQYFTGLNDRGVDAWHDLLNYSDQYLDECMSTIEWEKYDIVGFSVMFQQTLASLALARRIKAAHPHLKIVFGGPTCAKPMGDEMIRAFGEVDYVVQGEADATVAPFVREVRARPQGPFETPGILWRDAEGTIRESGPTKPFHDMDSLPIPDYTPYFEQMERWQLDHFHPQLHMENSRGCWWGEKSHCTFCGIDDELMVYRSKSAEKVLEEVLTLSRRHRITSFLTADNILDHRYYKTLLPELKRLREEEGFDFSFFFELKSNIRREHVELLRDAGVVQVQPGLESLSDEILKLMGKGASGIQQLQALKYLAERDIQPIWNLIYRNPLESPEDYEQMIEMIPFLHHLPPIERQNQVQMLLQRFNVYFERPEEFGIRNVRPQRFYSEIFPREDIDYEKLAFFFDYDHDDHGRPDLEAQYERLTREMGRWRRLYVRNSLTQVRGPGFVAILDRRWPLDASGRGEPPPARRVLLEGLEREVFLFCETFQAEAKVLEQFAAEPAERVLEILDRFVSERWLYRDGRRRHLSLPLLRDRKERYLGSSFGPEGEASDMKMPVAAADVMAVTAAERP